MQPHMDATLILRIGGPAEVKFRTGATGAKLPAP